MKLYIKNMVCSRCKMIVKSELEKLGLQPVSVELGEVELPADIPANKKQEIDNALQAYGFNLIDDKRSRLIERVKNLIVTLVHQPQEGYLKTNLSDYLSRELHHDYTYISNLFTQVEGTTIEKYYIAQKIERVKELLVYDELSLSEIAFQLHYSSVAHLSSQFKKVTGLTPSHFKQLGERKRRPLEEL
ncbi:helix-turn-helix domain-containing protein [Sinomicrobium weinanense]|uniref:Helix-turn-helix transcriptional regulator n=1 Tax=Sinomicrobium weinanense TaxID=2842200 RepID=A0A926Q1U9_9FLAO|nr:AraC family transcriptional regulator [Sinomicrobium weinanense]MBC9795923.1 helix-turn-helix transcriptional regulator [Sinomicrobium weinanense]MBU3124698.1 AraC family transcriptional regulator [Sinomicrobium weinanense]